MTDSREHILRTAFTLFLRKSFKEVTMNEIVDATGLSKGAFYHYFPSKEQLFVEVIDTYFFMKMRIDYDKCGKSSLQQFYRCYASQVDKIIREFKPLMTPPRSKNEFNYFRMMFDALNLFPGFREKVLAAKQEEFDAWIRVIKEGRERGEFESPMSDEQIARMFIYSTDGISLNLIFYGNFDEAELELITLWDNFYDELKD